MIETYAIHPLSIYTLFLKKMLNKIKILVQNNGSSLLNNSSLLMNNGLNSYNNGLNSYNISSNSHNIGLNSYNIGSNSQNIISLIYNNNSLSLNNELILFEIFTELLTFHFTFHSHQNSPLTTTTIQ